MIISDPVFYAAAIPAVILLGLSKGGFTGIGMLAMPLIALAISPIQGAAIILPILIVQDAVGVWVYRHAWDRRNMAILLPGAFFGALLGFTFAAYVSDAAISLAVGIISVVFGIRRLCLERKGQGRQATPASVPVGVFWGMVSGFTSMIANAGAPPFQVFILPQRLPKDLLIGTGILFFAALNWFKLPLFFALGQMTPGVMATSLVLFPLAIASTWAGVILVRRVSAERFYTVIYVLLVAVGGKLLWDGLRGL